VACDIRGFRRAIGKFERLRVSGTSVRLAAEQSILYMQDRQRCTAVVQHYWTHQAMASVTFCCLSAILE
jgi:hypothetical protein